MADQFPLDADIAAISAVQPSWDCALAGKRVRAVVGASKASRMAVALLPPAAQQGTFSPVGAGEKGQVAETGPGSNTRFGRESLRTRPDLR